MGCCHHYLPIEGGEESFTAQMPALTFGPGCLDEVGARTAARGLKRIALLTDARLSGLEPVSRAKASLLAAGLDAVVYDAVRIEPDVETVEQAAAFLRDGDFDGTVSVGGGSVIDTCKAASILASFPGELQAYLPAPNGEGRKVAGALKPHIACPTTAGTGSECTPLTVIDFPALDAKIPILSRHILPDEALVDPTCTYSLPRAVVAASAFDMVSHAIEGYTARPFSQRPAVADGAARVAIQGANPWSDLCLREALEIAARYLVRSVTDAADHEARDRMSWGATLAGMGFGNTGTHAPHAMGYPVSALNKGYRSPDYPGEKPMVPHGFSVIVNSPSVFRFTAEASPERHLDAASRLGADARGATPADAGEVVAARLIELMKATEMPNGVGGLGFTAEDVPSLARHCERQRRALNNAPRDIGDTELAGLYAGALAYW